MREIAHVGLTVQDCERSASFYEKVLGCQILDQFQDARIKVVFLKSGQGTLELIQHLTGQPEWRAAGVVDHIAFQVDDVEKETIRLKELGVSLLSDTPREVLDGKKVIFFSGPDGERLELIQEKKLTVHQEEK
ncbi:VOC family protein [Candidatus Formimonas warabiya]|uniref:VOC domain-containing protein n=1 Tax=Formimonas warabiya TaxID=1761012 RepID=A0A3G1KRM4_FORW1|nr:VOC family protein [Candidatus Formimonas warabiya]ATW25132.1 hypothetical protein DCMF_10445 [Candidatus Formimonas warabiya]